MVIKFGREICGHLETAESREWLVTNGIGGYASGTIANLLTRRYHGLLIAALNPPLGRTLMVAKVDETVLYNAATYPLYTNRWAEDTVESPGYKQIQSFHLEGTTPVWNFAIADAILEKRIWMQQGANTTYIRYHLRRATKPLTINLKTLINYRDYHHLTTNQWPINIQLIQKGVCVTAFPTAIPFYLLTDASPNTHIGVSLPLDDWHYGFNLAVEKYRGLDYCENHLHAATFQVTIEPGQFLTLVATTEGNPHLNSESAWELRRTYDQQIWEKHPKVRKNPDWINHLVNAADQFIVGRPHRDNPEGKTIIAGYPWFSDWGRDTMISLPGLTISTGRYEVARSILRTFSRYVDRGMLPNRFPDAGDIPEYNTVDATLWYFQAIWAYYEATNDTQLLGELWPVLTQIIDWHQRGTRYHIHLDPNDGLIYAGETGTQLTWMDAKVDDWVVTPRIGKPIEINALWYNALQAMVYFAQRLGKPYIEYQKLAQTTATGFTRFWNDAAGYCYDVLDGPEGNDDSLRPNQLFALSLPVVSSSCKCKMNRYTPLLTPSQHRCIVDICGQQLLTSHGLRSLSPQHPEYQGTYGGDSFSRDGAYHQGTVWGWLIGTYALAHLQVYKNPEQVREILAPMANHLLAHGVGSLSEIFDGDAPMQPRGCIAQAWTVAEVLRVWAITLN